MIKPDYVYMLNLFLTHDEQAPLMVVMCNYVITLSPKRFFDWKKLCSFLAKVSDVFYDPNQILKSF